MIDFSPVSFVKNIKFNSTNPINFKGAIKEDIFECRQESDPIKVKITSAKEKIAKTEAKIEEKNVEFEKLRLEYDLEVQKFKEKIKECYGEASEEYKAVKQNCDSFVFSIKARNIDYSSREKAMNILSKSWECLDKESEIKRLNDYCNQLREYISHLEIHPKTAFLYNPDISESAKSRELSMLSNLEIMKLKELSEELGIPFNIIKSHIRQGIFIADVVDGRTVSLFDKNTYTYIVDKDYKENEAYFLRIKELKENPNVIESGEFYAKYNFSEGSVAKCIEEGRLKTFFGEGANTTVFYIDPTDETNAKTIRDHLKIAPLKSRYYKSSAQDYDTLLVPAAHLSRLGFGSVKELHEEIQKGNLKGSAERQPDGKIKVTVDIASRNAELVLKNIRSRNKNVKSVKQLAQMLDVKSEEIEKALINDEMEIIPEFIFDLDYKDAYIDLRNEKNAQYIDKLLFEKQIEASLRKTKNSANSIRMKLVWAMCPYTKQVASDEAKHEVWVIPILDKKEQEGEEALSKKEQIQLNSYYKNVWLKAGVDEFKSALVAAKEILAQYKKGGIEAIESPEAREMLINILSEAGC